MPAAASTRTRPRGRVRRDTIARPPDDGRLALDYTEAAWLLHVHVNTIRNLVDRGVLQSVALGRRRLIPRTAVEALIARGGAA